jgi:adenosylhomocysteine nucleosidase
MKLLLFPLSTELNAFVAALKSRGHSSAKSIVHKLPVFEFKTLNIRCALGGHGKVQFAVQTQFLASHYQDTSSVYCIGTSGSLGDVKPLDVIIATETIEHDFNLKFVKKEKPRFRSDLNLVELFRKADQSLRDSLTFDIHFGAVASGDEDVLEIERAQAIKKETGALVVAWEGAGGARACKFLEIPYVEIRAVSDLADDSAAIDFRASVAESMDNVASLILRTPTK